MDEIVLPEQAAYSRCRIDSGRGPGSGLLLLVFAMLLVACGTPAPPVGPGALPQGSPPPRPVDRRAEAPSALSTERQWLQSWFAGTPVSIVQRGFGAVAIEVPREHCFEPGRSRVKPALGAVLDKVAQSMRRLPDARLALIAAPTDVAGAGSLAIQRANEVRRHLRSRGVAAARLAPAVVSGIAAVQLQIDLDD